MNATNDVITTIEADATLITLLGITASDPRIYPVEAPQGKSAPYIVYQVTEDRRAVELRQEFALMFKVVGSNYANIQDIEARLDYYLNQQDNINITSTNYIFKYSIKTTGRDMVDPDTGDNYRILIYDFITYKK